MSEKLIKQIDLVLESGNDFNKAFESFLKGCQKIVDINMKNSPSFGKRLDVKKGKKYWKIVDISTHEGKDTTQDGSVWAFINTINGDVLKPASWSAPAKHARGNIYDDKNGLGAITPYGPGYMRG